MKREVRKIQKFPSCNRERMKGRNLKKKQDILCIQFRKKSFLPLVKQMNLML